MSEPERLQLGRAKRRGSDAPKTNGRRQGQGQPKDGTFRERWKKRRRAKKKRIAAMSRKRRIARRAGIISTWFLGFIAMIMVAGVVLFYTLSDVPEPSTLPLPQVATILYSDGSVMARIGTVNRVIVTINQVPKPVQWDVLAAEDRNFYNEPGVSITGTIRAAINDLTGGDTQGGSGITQQYAKNAYLSNSRTLSRKLKELAIAVKLSRDYSKEQILEFYLNTVYFGRGTYGIESASKAYFGKDVSKLDVSQGAVLAALLRAPSYYDPAVNPGEAKARWKYVLDGMVSIGQLTQAQEDRLKFPKVKPPRKTSGLSTTGPKALIVQRVIAELEANGISETEIYARGLTIQTTINRKAQDDAESAINQTFGNLTKQQRNMKNALIAVDPSNGGVLAYYGGPNGNDYAGQKDYYDYAGLGSAAPGSSFKPYTLAAAADPDPQRQQAARQAARDQLDRQRQLLRDDRGHPDLQRPQRQAVQHAGAQGVRRDEVLAEHDVRPDGREGRSRQRRHRRAHCRHLEADQRAALAGRRERQDELRHRHRRLPGASHRSGRRLQHLRQRRHGQRRVLRREGDRVRQQRHLQAQGRPDAGVGQQGRQRRDDDPRADRGVVGRRARRRPPVGCEDRH